MPEPDLARALLPVDATDEQTRIMESILRSSSRGRCPNCGYARRTMGGIHPFAGVNGYTKSQTVFCNGKIKIYPTDYRHSDRDLEEGD